MFVYSLSKISISCIEEEAGDEDPNTALPDIRARDGTVLYLRMPLSPERRCSSRTFRYGYLVTT